MSAVLPAVIDPIRLAEEGSSLNGELSAKEMPRLRDLIADSSVTAQIILRFSRNAQGRMMEGTVTARLQLVCQRCLGAFEQVVTSEVRVALLREGESRSGLAADADFMEIAGPVSLTALVEDELLLTLPMMPAHPQGGCAQTAQRTEGDASAATAASPFSVLADFRRRQ